MPADQASVPVLTFHSISTDPGSTRIPLPAFAFVTLSLTVTAA